LSARAYRPDSLVGELLVDVVEPVSHELFLIVGDPALWGLPACAALA